MEFSYVLICIITILQGIPRVGFSFFLRPYFKLVGIEESKGNVIQIIRTSFEVVIYLSIKYLEEYFSLYTFLLIGTFSINIKYLLYLLNYGDKETLRIVCYQIGEIGKAIFSCMFGYSVPRISSELASEHNKTLTQGIYYCCYNSLPTLIFILTSLLSLDKEVKSLNINQYMNMFKILFICAIISTFLAIVLSYIVKRRKN